MGVSSALPEGLTVSFDPENGNTEATKAKQRVNFEGYSRVAGLHDINLSSCKILLIPSREWTCLAPIDDRKATH